MFTAFDENAFWKAIEEKDYVSLKVNTVSSMLDDPTFARGETEKVLKILNDKVPEIFETEIKLDYEERLERSAWDKRYFTKLTYWFQENFAKSRIPYIKEVGRAVHQDTARAYAESMKIGSNAENNARHNSSGSGKPASHPAHAPKPPKSLPTTGIVIAAVALVLILVWLVRGLLK